MRKPIPTTLRRRPSQQPVIANAEQSAEHLCYIQHGPSGELWCFKSIEAMLRWASMFDAHYASGYTLEMI